MTKSSEDAALRRKRLERERDEALEQLRNDPLTDAERIAVTGHLEDAIALLGGTHAVPVADVPQVRRKLRGTQWTVDPSGTFKRRR